MYIKYEQGAWRQARLIIANPDGSGATGMELPADARLPFLDIAEALSPTGEWLVFHTGSVGSEHPLTLNLAHIPDGKVRVVTPLLSQTDPGNLDELAQRWPVELPDLFAPDIGWRSLVDNDFSASLYAFAWSPDGRSLAFSGQLDGPSSDVYLFDLATDEIRRLTDDILNTSDLEWSPDGQWLVQINSVPGEIYGGSTLHRLDPQARLQRTPILQQGIWWSGLGWLTNHRYVMAYFPDGAYGKLWYLDLDVRQSRDIWPAGQAAYDVDPGFGVVYVAAVIQSDEDTLVVPDGAGLYVVDLEGRIVRFIAHEFWSLTFRGGEVSRMYASDGERLYGISAAGNLAVVSDRGNVDVQISPDSGWAAVFDGETVELFDTHDTLVNRISIPGVLDIHWRPDSQGFYAVQCHALAYYSIAQEVLDTFAESEAPVCEYSAGSFVWVPGSAAETSP